MDPDNAQKWPQLNIPRWRDIGDVRGWGADPKGKKDSTEAFTAAAIYVGEGGVLKVPSGTYLLKTLKIKPVTIEGSGQGRTILVFNNLNQEQDGVVFLPPEKNDIEFGARDISIKTINGHGSNAFYTPRAVGLNQKRLKPTFQRISFSSEDAGIIDEDFSQTFSWKWMFNLGDSWNLSIDDIDAVGSFLPSRKFDNQFLDGFIRTAPEEGILSMRLSDITTHNIANFLEIKQKTYFQLANVDVARALNGIYDANDRVFESPNRYSYGESIWTNVIINAQLNPIKLDNRFLLIINGLAIHRAENAYDHGGEWVGVWLTRPRVCTLQGLEIGCAKGYSGKKIGILIDAGDANNFSNVSFGQLDVCAQIGITNSRNGSNQATKFNNTSINSDVSLIFEIQNARQFICSGYSSSSTFSFKRFLMNVDSINNTMCLSNIEDSNECTDNSIYWENISASRDEKKWRWDTRDGLTLCTQADTGGNGNNALIIRRDKTSIASIEMRTNEKNDSSILFNSPKTRFSGEITPLIDNEVSNGSSSHRWAQVYAKSGTINTSDAREKSVPILINEFSETLKIEPDAILDAWGEVSIVAFQWLDMIEKKGSNKARWHFGVIAQQVRDAFELHGIDGTRLGLLCYDEWNAEYAPVLAEREVIKQTQDEHGFFVNSVTIEEYDTGKKILVRPAGYRWGIRSDQCAWLEAAYQRRRCDRLEERLQHLEKFIQI